jgi:hypothetical protein
MSALVKGEGSIMNRWFSGICLLTLLVSFAGCNASVSEIPPEKTDPSAAPKTDFQPGGKMMEDQMKRMKEGRTDEAPPLPGGSGTTN